MKKGWFISLLVVSMLLLVACGDNNDNNTNNNPPEVNNNQNNEINDNNAENIEDDDNENQENNNDNDDNNDESTNDSSGPASKGDTEDQLDLEVGDTGTFDTTLGTYDMTLEKAELLDGELDGVQTGLDDLILLDITIKNTSDQTQEISDLLGSMEVNDRVEGSGFGNSSGSFDSVEDFVGELEPGEEESGQFITEVYDADEYYFKKQSGNISGGSSNQVIWEIKADEAK